jgi:hypothetical protein
MTDTIATYNEFLRLTGDATAASNLVLAHALKNANAVTPATPLPESEPEGMLNLERAAAYLGCTVHGLRKVVTRTQQSREGKHIKGPTIEFFQQRKWSTILFRREWLDEYVERNHLRAGSPKQPVTQKRRQAAGQNPSPLPGGDKWAGLYS